MNKFVPSLKDLMIPPPKFESIADMKEMLVQNCIEDFLIKIADDLFQIGNVPVSRKSSFDKSTKIQKTIQICIENNLLYFVEIKFDLM